MVSVFADVLLKDESCASAIRIQWNLAWYGSLQDIFNTNLEHLIDSEYLKDFSVELLLTREDLACLKYSSIDYCCQTYLHQIQNAASHSAVADSINGLTA